MQILDQIIRVLEPGREPDKTFADAEFGARLRRQPLMRGGRGMGDEAFCVAEIVRYPRQLECVEGAECRRLAVLNLDLQTAKCLAITAKGDMATILAWRQSARVIAPSPISPSRSRSSTIWRI